MKPKEIFKSTFEQYESSYIICGKCDEKIGINDSYCKYCGEIVEREGE